MNQEQKQEPTFESAFQRLECILEKMNSNQTTLDESLALFEEAETLISFCNKRLTEAEQKVEKLVKNRSGELVLGKNGQPTNELFQG